MSSSDEQSPLRSALTPASLIAVLSAACADVLHELARVPLAHWNESVFRFFIVQRLLADMPNLDCRTEWHCIDLVLFDPEGATLLELKFFSSQPLCDKTGRVLRMKGVPGNKNLNEYKAAIEKLRTIRRSAWITDCGDVASAYLLLAYSDSVTTSKPTFGSYYDGIAAGGPIASVRTILERAPGCQDSYLTCNLITVDVAPMI
jgi:hypothetical protein